MKFLNSVNNWLNSLSISAAIVIAAIVLGFCYLGSNLYKVERIDNTTYLLINSLTGSVHSCKTNSASC
jgi:hypothetical protein